ncbi:MAG: hypothetical protein EAZ39_16675 [Oscillatoriales cyanobacterium]|jgi:hypothetical protein|uniref:hypothetical protein n=1 Tax=Microcoleus sp. PH2017_05_CCC_O_A TaxID=2798816 RepID=UPI001D3403DA|nr:hypothetical protein [Microcoleus sp. PH2017_05_CCC_O_A]TAG05579.1 MAG: hypothetical protein EAZ45_05850 [Oscillatoriales cyanobacterium]MCC3437964.1 hypothetical protein [Microcoleus sp. PH2017_05_CCC_O_A]TAG16616.1 MAG: hypothetical protein EAZ39_16675 [Oscillatoriales cyanobacterium]TAG47800.1 MAG: hypothetical protein EAZ33_04195 [Oscillatoriales cyanobacterium]TAG50568.1 MAG: hypothetical protein EAZ28_32600 [Oscillatoriales cyanobacterium]
MSRDSEKISYSEKTERLKVITQFIKTVTPMIWTIVIIVVIIPLLGNFLISKSLTNTATTTVVVSPPHDFSKINQDLKNAIQKANTTAETFASKELDKWETEVIARVDNSFLDWYFDYFNQKKMEFTVPFNFVKSAVLNRFDMTAASRAVSEKLTEDFQREFANRVLVPKNAQLKFQLITQDTANLYIAEVSKNVKVVQNNYNIPQVQWDKYLNDIATTISDKGNVSNLSLKVLVGGSGYLIAKPLILGVATKVGSKVTAKVASKAAAKIATKTGGTVASQLGVGLIDPIVGVGIIMWDLWDYNHTVTIERPILREHLVSYLKDVKKSLLTNPETGIMAAIYQLESGILKSLS